MLVKKKTSDNLLMELKTEPYTCEFIEEQSLIRDKIVLRVCDKNLQEYVNITFPNLEESSRSKLFFDIVYFPSNFIFCPMFLQLFYGFKKLRFFELRKIGVFWQ